MTTTLTTEQVEEILALAASATPVEPRDLMAYDHGGGRLAVIRDGKRDLIADFYGDGADRDYYAALRPQTVSSLATELLALRKRVGELDEWQDISTATDQMGAPWDGKPVLIHTNRTGSDADRTHRARWTDDVHGSGIFGWAVEDMKFGPYALRGHTLVTHWQPLPAAPLPTPKEPS